MYFHIFSFKKMYDIQIRVCVCIYSSVICVCAYTQRENMHMLNIVPDTCLYSKDSSYY